MEALPARPTKMFILVVLLPLLEPAAHWVALSEGPDWAGGIARAWLVAAPIARLAAILVGALASLLLVQSLWIGELARHRRAWGLLLIASLCGVASSATLDPREARLAARERAQAEGARIRQAIRDYQLDKGRPLTSLRDLVPGYLSPPANPRVAGSSVEYRLKPTPIHGYEIQIPCPGRETPLFVHRGASPTLNDRLHRILRTGR